MITMIMIMAVMFPIFAGIFNSGQRDDSYDRYLRELERRKVNAAGGRKINCVKVKP